jgi:ABC-type sulfate transport system substrate-binding protein
LNVSYDPTREFYREYNELFNAWWTAEGTLAVIAAGHPQAQIDDLLPWNFKPSS